MMGSRPSNGIQRKDSGECDGQTTHDEERVTVFF